MLTPEGLKAENIDKIMLLAMWTRKRKLEKLSQDIIAAGMGKPTYPVNSHTVAAYLQYWNNIQLKLEKASFQAKEGEAIDYGDPSGDKQPLQLMASALTKWYGVEFCSNNLLFTVGGAGALRVIFETFNDQNKDIPHYRVITPFPHYTLYSDNRHTLHPIGLMKQEGYRLTKQAIMESIEEAYNLSKNDGNIPKMMLLCNPVNPLGTSLTETEFNHIAEALREYPDIHLVLDEAYAEMNWRDEKALSVYEIAPDLKERITVLRSATKGHSAAGERMAVMMTFNHQLMGNYRSKNISLVGHAPKSSQYAYATAMSSFDANTKRGIKEYYQPKLMYVSSRLKEMAASMPDPVYTPEATFYVMADLSDLFGMKIPEGAEQALGYGGKVKTSEELVYALLFEENIMLAPGEYFGLSPSTGYCRITCSASNEELEDLMNRLDSVLFRRRTELRKLLLSKIESNLDRLHELSVENYQVFKHRFSEFLEPKSNKELHSQLGLLKDLSSDLNVILAKIKPNGKIDAAKTIQAFFRRHLSHKKGCFSEEIEEKEWKEFVNNYTKEGALRNYFLNMPKEERNSFLPWVERKEKLTVVHVESCLAKPV